ncbi:MAG TPA: hypothetical protein VKZ63_05630 [Kofleriaceae bacterium]|nr:hypothetical protein [Kofleriaceae bacterium]
MRVVGDPVGVAALREMAGQNRDFLRFLIQEARSSTDHQATFTSGDGARWTLRLDLATGDLDVQRAPG